MNITDVRPEIQKFAIAMEEKLRAVEAKYPGRSWKEDSSNFFLTRIEEEVEELEDELYVPEGSRRPLRILDEAVDVANFAMFIADVEGGLP